MSSVDSKKQRDWAEILWAGMFFNCPTTILPPVFHLFSFSFPSLRCVRADPEGGMWCDQKNKHQVLQPEMFSLLALPRLLKNWKACAAVLAMHVCITFLHVGLPLRAFFSLPGLDFPGDIPIQTGRAVEGFFFLLFFWKRCFAMFYWCR